MSEVAKVMILCVCFRSYCAHWSKCLHVSIVMYVITNQPWIQLGLYCAHTGLSLLSVSLLFQVHYDGWSHVYDEWMDSDHSDIHPAGWCEATGHPLKVPPRDPKTQQPHGNNQQHISLLVLQSVFFKMQTKLFLIRSNQAWLNLASIVNNNWS